MGVAAVIGVCVLVVVIAVVWFTVRYMRTERSQLPAELIARRDALCRRIERIIEQVPDKPRLDSHEVPDHPGAAAIEAKLLIGDSEGALHQAEQLMANHPEDPRVHILLARVLIHVDEISGAEHEIRRARTLGAKGPMIEYLEGRVHHLRTIRQVNPQNVEVQNSPVPSLITPFDMFILQLEGQRQRSQEAAALWLASTGGGERTLAHDEITALIVNHFSTYYDSLDKLMSAAESAPGFAEALYHTARLALKVGFIRQGIALMNRIEPLMANSPEKRYYRRDMAELRDEEVPSALSNLPRMAPKTASGARRSKSLKILN